MKLTYSPHIAQPEGRVQADLDAIPRGHTARYRARQILDMELRIVREAWGDAGRLSPTLWPNTQARLSKPLRSLSTFVVTRPLISRLLKRY